jgi:hypothetical protein
LVVGTLSSIRIWRCKINTPRILMQQVTTKTFTTDNEICFVAIPKTNDSPACGSTANRQEVLV